MFQISRCACNSGSYGCAGEKTPFLVIVESPRDPFRFARSTLAPTALESESSIKVLELARVSMDLRAKVTRLADVPMDRWPSLKPAGLVSAVTKCRRDCRTG